MAYNPRSTNRHKREQLRARLTAIYHTCPICGQPLDTTLRTPHPMSVEIDEIIPIAKGGNPYQLSNLELVHRHCNRLKSTHTLEWAQQQTRNKTTKNVKTQPYTTTNL